MDGEAAHIQLLAFLLPSSLWLSVPLLALKPLKTSTPTWLRDTLFPPPPHRIARLLRLALPCPRSSLPILCPLLRLLLPSGRRAAPLGPPPWIPLLAPLSCQFSTS